MEFKKFSEDEGISHQLSVSYTHKQNSVIERKNKSVVKMVRCMLVEKKLPNSFQAKTAHIVVYLQNQ